MIVDRRPLIVGEAPSRSSDPLKPLSGRSGRRLSELAGFEIGDRFELRNLLDYYPGRDVKGSRFSMTRFARVPSGRPTVILGKRAAKALGLRLEFFEERESVIVIPHPSGVNTLYNDPSIRQRTGDTLRRFSCRT